MKLSKNAKKIFWGVLFIAAAVLLLLDLVGVFDIPAIDIPFWKLALALLLLWQIVNEISHLRPAGIFFPLALIALLFEKNISRWMGLEDGYLGASWILLLIALLLTIGTTILFPRQWFLDRIRRNHKGKGPILRSAKQKRSSHLSSKTIYIDASSPFHEEIEVNLGSVSIYFTNTDLYVGGGVLSIDNSLGSVTVHLPPDWSVESSIDNTLGSVSIDQSDAANPQKRLLIEGDNNLGHISVVYAAEE